jgi:L-alanine-DL-glutamate epimerase-like enolase superfamily enzyme
MKITGIEAIPLVRKLETAFEGGTYRIVNRYTLVTRVYTDEGLIGEVFGGDEDFTQDDVVKIIRECFGPLLIGEDPRNVERLWQKMYTAPVNLGNRGLHTHDLRNRGSLMQAIAGVDMAIWDLLGKLYGVPLAVLLGGYKDRVPVMAIGGYYKAGKGQGQLDEEMQSYRDLGIRAVKFKVGRVSVAQDIERVSRVRAVVGDDFMIAVDANQGWTPQQAIEFCREAEKLNLLWVEEPVRWYDQIEGLRMVRDHSPIPINAGQGELTGYGCRDLVINRCVDLLNVDVTIAGGVTEWRRIANFAGLFHVRMAHHEEPQVALHLLASIPHSTYVEIFPSYERDPMWVDLPLEHPVMRDGYFEVPTGNGLGIALNEEIIARYRAS